jgi:DNA-3-methyladenine glycosylase II
MRRAITHLKRCDPVLAAIIERVGPFALTYRDPTFEAMVRAIAFQQLNGKAAATIFNRLVACAGGITPENILALTEERMRACGLSGQKLAYIRDLAAKAQSGEVDFARLSEMPDEEVIEHLTRVKGIGVWSAQMFLMFALRRPDVMPTADYGIRVAIQKAYRKRKLPDPKTILKISAPWQPWRSVACWYLWRSLDNVTPG